MRYQTPQMQLAGVASELIQAKITPKVDPDNNLRLSTLSSLLESD